MKNLNFKVDKSKCIRCGLCIKDCSCSVLEFDENKNPRVAENGETRCMKCQHCLAVCPTGAISILGKNPDESLIPQKEKSPDVILNQIQSRRSVRHYKQANLDKETLAKLKNMLNWVPTGCNDHRLLFAFIDDIDAMAEFKEKVYAKLKNLCENKPFPKDAERFLSRLESVIISENRQDVIFRNAPHMIVACSPVDAPCVDIDPVIALSYFELYAQSLGVGTVWCGLAQSCLNILPELSADLKIPQGYKPVYCMLFGPPAIKFKRIIQPKPYKKVSSPKNLAKFRKFLKSIGAKIINFVK